MNREFFRRLRILLWAAVNDDICHCYFHPPIALEFRLLRPWKSSSPGYPALRIGLNFQQPAIYLPYTVIDAYNRRNWTAQQWEEWRQTFDDIPF